MSPTASPADSPVSIQPLHNPAQAAHVSQALGMGAKALLAKKMAKSHGNPAFVSPTDSLVTPVTKKLNDARRKNFVKGAKPTKLFDQPEGRSDEEGEEEDSNPSTTTPPKDALPADDENPF